LGNGIVTTVSEDEGLSDDLVHSVYEDRAGTVWAGTFRGGLNRIDDAGIRHYTEADGLPSGRVWSIRESSQRDGRMWLGTPGGLVRLENDAVDVFTTADGLPSDLVRVVYEDRVEPETLWLGTIDAGLVRWRDGAVERWSTGDGLAHDNVRWLLRDRSGDLWIGTENGLNRLDGDRLTTVEAPTARSRTRCAHEDGDGTIWIGTAGGGLLRFRDGRFDTFTTDDGLPTDDVWAIEEDAAGDLWISGPEGLARIERASLGARDAGTGGVLRVETFSTLDGMKNPGATAGGFPGSWKGDDGRLWFTTMAGVVAVEPDRIVDPAVPRPLVESVTVDGETLDLSDTVSIPAGTSHLTIRYTSPSLALSHRLRFRYRLVGYEESWIEAAGERAAYYTRLAPGGYRFEVAASFGTEGASGPTRVVSIAVMPS
jgi:ligand-binding sensor domain-containing protein